ncbi:hypothetical protein [Mesorhizobium sp.]|uniref:hypothetical protein n=1 Tax=Mesorhizobium sp. TaxID=1871066 RepID=UPI0025804A78|nr:hypothetical protein [Mesorhizobium sp.]
MIKKAIKKSTQVPADPYRKARFRKMARDIVAKDRHDRKYGMAVDTAGAIARALEKAYRQGFEDNRVGRPSQSQEPAAQDGPLDWALIPPRPRNAFWSICLFTLGMASRHRKKWAISRRLRPSAERRDGALSCPGFRTMTSRSAKRPSFRSSVWA